MTGPRPLRRLLSACVLACAACRAPAPPAVPPVDAAFVAATNAAAGLMGRYDFAAAVGAFDALAASHPASAETAFNLAVARINRQQPDDAAEAERRLRALVDHSAMGTRARYALGLLLLYQGRDADAFPLLSAIATTVRDDAFPAYFAGQARLAQDPADALTWFDRASAIDPLLRSAPYGAFQALQRLGRADEATGRLATFQALERDPRARLAEFKYTRMGPLAEAVFVDAPSAPAPMPAGARFSPVSIVSALPPADRRGASITVADIDGDGALDLFVAGGGPALLPNAVLMARGDTWDVRAGHPLAAVPGVRAALWGDLDDDGRTDVVLVRGGGRTAFWRQTGPDAWRDVTAEWRAASPRVDAVDGALVDADHDGDLDVVLVNAAGPTALLNNNGDHTFRNIAAQAGIAGDGRPAAGLAVADLDGDRDHDLVVLKTAPPHDVWLNDRVWQYRRATGYDAFAAATMDAVVAADLDADGRPELYATSARGLERWQSYTNGDVRAQALVPGDALPRATTARMIVADTDGNGTRDLLVSAGASWTVVDVPPEGAARVVEGGGSIAAWTVATVDAARGPAVVGVDARGVVAWQPGPGRQPFLAIQPTGRSQASDQRRSNASGIGTRVHVRTGSRWTAFDTVRLQSGGGQSLQPTAVGLGGAARADLVSLVWSDGILQTELGLEAGRLHTIAETQRQLSSCPVLFAYDGTATRFVTDLLGVGGIGFFERPGVYSPPFPQESVLLPDGSLGATRDGRLRLVIGEPMEEVAYLDHVELAAYDLPPGWHLALDERKAIASAPPTGAPLYFREERRPLTARNDRGEDVTAAIADADLHAAPPGAVDARFIGLTARHSLELAFAADLERGPGRPLLVVDGWVEYPYAQTVFAAWQARVTYEAPTLEAKGRDGRWHVVAPEFGYPAGMPRRMTLPLGGLPAGTRALRLTTTQEIYWDRVTVAYAEASPAAEAAVRVLPLASATLAEGGFAVRTTGPQRTPAYDYDRRLPLWDTRYPRGWYTRFGDVRALLDASDDATVILGPGEEVVLDFAAPSTSLPPGWTRHYVLRSRGWCKDMDLYTRDGETVAPLPGRETAARQRLHATFNTRFKGGQ